MWKLEAYSKAFMNAAGTWPTKSKKRKHQTSPPADSVVKMSYQTIHGPQRRQFMFETERATYFVDMKPSYSPLTGGLEIDSQLRLVGQNNT